MRTLNESDSNEMEKVKSERVHGYELMKTTGYELMKTTEIE